MVGRTWLRHRGCSWFIGARAVRRKRPRFSASASASPRAFAQAALWRSGAPGGSRELGGLSALGGPSGASLGPPWVLPGVCSIVCPFRFSICCVQLFFADWTLQCSKKCSGTHSSIAPAVRYQSCMSGGYFASVVVLYAPVLARGPVCAPAPSARRCFL